MKKGGWRIVYQEVMRNPNISAEAKAIYACEYCRDWKHRLSVHRYYAKGNVYEQKQAHKVHGVADSCRSCRESTGAEREHIRA